MTVDLKIFAEGLDNETMAQIMRLAYSGVVEGDVRAMPDAHAGAGCTIGTVCKFTGMSSIDGVVVPNVVGVDIGCGMLGYRIPDIDINFEELDADLKRDIPLGMNHRTSEPSNLMTMDDLRAVNLALDVQDSIGRTRNPADKQVGTLGGGNHFIEINQGKYCKWVIIHSGSRNFGLTVAEHYQKLAKESCGIKGLEGLKMTEGGYEYLRDMKVAQMFAQANRNVMMRSIMESLETECTYAVECVHNYIAEDGICRKGAISAYKGEPVLIPLNMRDGTVIGVGKGNEDYMNSAPHGAGRLFGRGAMKRRLASGEITVEGFQNEMKDVYTTTATAGNIDESPMAYKPFETIEKYLRETVEIREIVKPVYNLKGGE